MAFDTGSPIGSTDAQDLYDNAQNLDYAVNQSAARWTDRLGVSRPSWAGMVAYADRGAYAAGMVITGYNEMFLFDGEYYRAAAATVLPYTTTGSWSDDGIDFVSIGDAVLRSDLIEKPNEVLPIYNGMINISYFGTLEEARTNSEAAGRTIVVDVPLTEAQSNIVSAWPADRALKIEKGGSIANSTAFTINGPFKAGLYQVFIGAGGVILGSGSTEYGVATWWGVIGDNTDISPNWQKAINNCSTSGKGLYVPRGTYTITQAMILPAGFSMWGESNKVTAAGTMGTVINHLGTEEAFVTDQTLGGTGLLIKDFRIIEGVATKYAIKSHYPLTTVDGIYIENSTGSYLGNGIKLHFDGGQGGCWDSKIINCKIVLDLDAVNKRTLLYLDINGGNVLISKNILIRGGVAIDVHNGSKINIVNNNIERMVDYVSTAASIQGAAIVVGSAITTPQAVAIDNNYFELFSRAVLVLSGENTSIANNYINDTSGYDPVFAAGSDGAIHLASGFDGALLTNNNITSHYSTQSIVWASVAPGKAGWISECNVYKINRGDSVLYNSVFYGTAPVKQADHHRLTYGNSTVGSATTYDYDHLKNNLTVSGSGVIATATPTTIFTGVNPAVYQISAWQTDGASFRTANSIVILETSGSGIKSLVTSADWTLTLSTNSVVLTNTSGVTRAYKFICTKVQ